MSDFGERIWTLQGPTESETYACELHDRGRWGVEAMILWNGRLLIGQRFDTRALALEWAAHEQADMADRQARLH